MNCFQVRQLLRQDPLKMPQSVRLEVVAHLQDCMECSQALFTTRPGDAPGEPLTEARQRKLMEVARSFAEE